jgi:hypothetical protein
VYSAVERTSHHKSIEDLEAAQEEPKTPAENATHKQLMKHRLATLHGQEVYRLRKQTVEPVFGIIKAGMKFRCFSLRGIKGVKTEWNLVTLSYNIKRMFNLKTAT